MKKICWIKIGIFLLFSIIFALIFLKPSKYRDYSIVVTLRGDSAQPLDYFSSNDTNLQRVQYIGGGSLSTARFKPAVNKMKIGHRFDFGDLPGKTFLISSIVLEKPGYQRAVLDLSRAKDWIKTTHHMLGPEISDGKLLLKTTGNDSYMVTRENIFEKYAKYEYNIPPGNLVRLIIAELILILFLIASRWIFIGVCLLKRTVFTKKFFFQFMIFLAVNLFIITPVIYFSCRNIPDEFIITVKSPKQSVLTLYHKRPYSSKRTINLYYKKNDKFQQLRTKLPPATLRENIRIDFGYQPNAFEIKSLAILKYGIILKNMDIKDFPHVYTPNSHIAGFTYTDNKLVFSAVGTDPYIIPSSKKYLQCEYTSLQFNKIFRYILFVELLLLFFLSETVRNLIRKISPAVPKTKENLLLSMSVAGAFVFVLGISLPLQTYKMAEEIILFKMNVLLSVLYWLVPCSFILLGLALYGLNKRYGNIFSFIVASLTVLFVLETGPLAFGLPELNGEFDSYHSTVRSLIHLIIWVFVIIVPLFFQKKLSAWLPLCVLAASLLSAAALGDALLKKNPMQNRGRLIVPSTTNFDGTVDGVRYAEKNNVIVICLDTVTPEVAKKIFAEHPKLKEQFHGFSSFTNNIGMNVSTMWAVPGIFTGKLSTLDIPPTEFTTSLYSEDSALKKYIDQNYAIYIRVGLPRLSYLNPDCREDLPPVTIFTPVEDSMLQWLFHELYSFKIAPFFMKETLLRYYFYSVWPNRQKKNQLDNSFLTSQNRDENYIYDKLSNAPFLDKKYPGAFHYHHFHGGHPPYKYDKDGNLVDRSNIPYSKDWTGYYERVYFEFKRVAKYLESLKKRGLYDSSVIIVCADHGSNTTLTKSPTMAKFTALLMVKTHKSSTPYTEYDIPTSHSKISEFLKGDIFNIKQKELPEIFRTEIRYILHNRYKEYTVNAAKKIIKSRKLEMSTAELKNIEPGFKYSLFFVSNDHFPPIRFVNITEQINCLMVDGAAVGQITFKVADPSAKYNVSFEAFLNPGADRKTTAEIRVKGKSEKISFSYTDHDFKIRDIQPDKNGYVTLCFKRNGSQGTFMMKSMKVDKQ